MTVTAARHGDEKVCASATRPGPGRDGSIALWLICIASLFWAAGYPLRYGLFEASVGVMLAAWIGLVSRKPFFSMVLSAGLCAGVSHVSFLKHSNMGQKLYFDDLQMLWQGAEQFVGFVSIWAWLAGVMWLIVLVAAFRRSSGHFSPRWLVFCLLASTAVMVNFLKTDQYVWHYDDQFGGRGVTTFVGSAVYPKKLIIPPAQPDQTCCIHVPETDLALQSSADDSTKLPHVVSVLLESQMDLNDIPGMNVKNHWRTFQTGPMRVYTRGGGTWIQEYAFLHGTAPPVYGQHFGSIHRLGPGILKGRIAPALAQMGYATRSVVPYASRTYSTKRFHGSLGMSDVTDCQDLKVCGRSWEASDDAVFQAAGAQLASAKTPQFMFLLTMHQHGPHDPTHTSNGVSCAANISVQTCNQAADFHRREGMVQQRILNFVKALEHVPRRVVVIFWGDHIPPFAEVHLKQAQPGANGVAVAGWNTVAFLYDSGTRKFISPMQALGIGSPQMALNSEDLDLAILRLAGFRSVYLDHKMNKYKTLTRN